MSYNVDTHNLFSLLDGDGTPAKVAAAKPESKPAAKPATTDKTTGDKTTTTGGASSGRGKPQGTGRGGRGGRGGARGGRGGARGGDRPPRGDGGAISTTEDGFESKPRPRRPAGEGRPTGERREKDGEPKAPRPGKRTFDRRSGTGRGGGKPAKSGAGGKGTWGKAGDELNAEGAEPKAEASAEGETTEVAAAEGAEAPAAAAPDAAVPDRAPKEKDEDDKLLSLEQFEKLRVQKLAAISAPSSAPKREVQAQFNDCEKLQRDSEDETLFPVAKGGKKKAKKAKKSDAVPIDKVFKVHLESSSDSAPRDSPRGRGGRGRGGRGGNFHKKDHHHKSSSSSDSFDFDPSKFPSLQSQ